MALQCVASAHFPQVSCRAKLSFARLCGNNRPTLDPWYLLGTSIVQARHLGSQRDASAWEGSRGLKADLRTKLFLIPREHN